MKNKGTISITIDFNNAVKSQDEARFAVIKALLDWAKDEIYVMRTSKGAEIPFEFNDEDKED